MEIFTFSRFRAREMKIFLNFLVEAKTAWLENWRADRRPNRSRNKFRERNDKSVNTLAKQNTAIKLFGLLPIYDVILSSFNRRPLEYARNTGPRFTTYVQTINSICLADEYRYKVVPIFYKLKLWRERIDSLQILAEIKRKWKKEKGRDRFNYTKGS